MRVKPLRTRASRTVIAVAVMAAAFAGTAGGARSASGASARVAAPAAAQPTSVAVIIDPLLTTIEQINAAAGTTTLDSIEGAATAYLLAPPAGIKPAAVARQIKHMRGVIEAEANGETDPPEVAGTRLYRWAGSDAQSTEDQYADTTLDLGAAHAISMGAGTTVAIVDTGIQLLPNPHPDLAGVTGTGVDFVGNDGVPDDEANGIDDNGDGAIDEGAGHGTFIAGIVHRVAPDATILPVRVLDSEGTGDEWTMAKGLFWAADHGADVVNVSAGRHSSASFLVRSVDILRQLGVVVVMAAGNDGRNRNELPAIADCGLAVTGTGPTDKVSKFSTLGGWVDVGAPAEAIHSTFPFFASGYAVWNGTSFAAPFATGQALLLRSLSPQLSVGDVLTYIKGTSVRYKGTAAAAGFGRIDPAASLVALQNGARPSPKRFDVAKDCFKTGGA